jgi:hypothetical protein
MKLVTVGVVLMASVSGNEYLCPQLTCAYNAVDGECFSNIGSNSLSHIKFYAYTAGQICNIDGMHYAWFQTPLQVYFSGTQE